MPLPLPRKRKLELFHESVRYVVTEYAVLFRPQLVAIHCRAEDVIEEREVRGVIAIQRRLILTVVPMVEVWRDDDVCLLYTSRCV